MLSSRCKAEHAHIHDTNSLEGSTVGLLPVAVLGCRCFCDVWPCGDDVVPVKHCAALIVVGSKRFCISQTRVL